MEIFTVKILKDIDQSCFENLLSQLDGERQQIIFSMKDLHARLAMLTSDLLIRHVIKNKLGLNNEEIRFVRNEYGKPRLIGRRDFYFNLSHSGDWAVCVVDTKSVGIDIEKIDYKNPKIVPEILSPVESDIYKKLGTKEGVTFFYDIWTRKESYIKALGIGLNTPLDDLTVCPKFKSEDDIFSLTIENVINSEYFFKQYFVDSDYFMTVCAMDKNFAKKVEFIDNGLFLKLQDKIELSIG